MEKINAQLLDVILDKYLGDSGLREQLLTVQVYEAWEHAVGERNARATISRYFVSGILYCTIGSSALRNMLYFNLEETRRCMNDELGAEFVKKIVLR